jgi:hypothetical protein
MFTPFDDFKDGDLIRRIAALRRIRTGRPMGYPRYSGEITLMLAELMARGVELDEKGNRLFMRVEPRPVQAPFFGATLEPVNSVLGAFRCVTVRSSSL